jgi:hypothetical protein
MENENKFILIHVCGKDFRFLALLRAIGFKICKKRYNAMRILFKTNSIWVSKSAEFDADFESVGKFGIEFFRKKVITITE